LVSFFVDNKVTFERDVDNLIGLFIKDKSLLPFIHSVKGRVKDSGHLKDKLKRNWLDTKKKHKKFNINRENLFTKINDLSGVRILHLHTRQIQMINNFLTDILEAEQYELIEGPIAKTWDDETRGYFKDIGIKTEKSETMYTSVHYIVKINRRTKRTAEIQVRTLAEELWGEVDHAINYPHSSKISDCREQIKVLARVTSSCSRLVDSIFRSHQESKKY
jgi:ppGpp synthetase/RelA/SpoT-type nucleotidyltranferase